MSDNTSMIADAVSRMLADSALGSAEFDTALWRTLSESGVPRLLRPESEGGAGNACRDVAEVLQAVGRHGATVPLADSLVAHALLSRAGIDPADEAPIELQINGPDGSPDPAFEASRALPRAVGAHRLVVDPWGRAAQCEWRPASGSSKTFELAEVDWVNALIALTGAAVITGAMRRAFELTLEWAGTRVQFGRPIGQFQAVQHALALAAEEIAASRAALDWAAADLEAGRTMPAAQIARARSAEAAGKVAAITHQAHGAIGFTAEYELYRYTRLMWLWRDRWGNETHWQAVLGQAALAGNADDLFDLVIGEPR